MRTASHSPIKSLHAEYEAAPNDKSDKSRALLELCNMFSQLSAENKHYTDKILTKLEELSDIGICLFPDAIRQRDDSYSELSVILELAVKSITYNHGNNNLDKLFNCCWQIQK